MKHQNFDGWELYTPLKRDPLSNDWYIIPVIVIGSIIAFIAFVGVERFFNVMAQFIGGIITN